MNNLPVFDALRGVGGDFPELAGKEGTEKRNIPPTPPIKRKGKGEKTADSSKNSSFAGARGRVRTREEQRRWEARRAEHTRLKKAVDAEMVWLVDLLGGNYDDRKLWSAYAWNNGVEMFHRFACEYLSRLRDYRYPPRNKPAHFQRALQVRFGERGV